MPKQTFDFSVEDKEILDRLKHDTGLSYVAIIRKLIRHYDSGRKIHGLIPLKRGES